jgi:hypothetical protein
MTQDADALRQRLEKYDGDRAGFVIHMSIFLIVNALLWGIWSLSGGFSSAWPWPLLLTLTWGSGLTAHGLSNYFDSAQRVVDREKTVQQMTTGQVKKKKRMERLMLTDDGEFLEVVDEQSEDDQNVQLSSH